MALIASPPLAPQAAVPGSLRHLPVNLFASVMGLSGLALAWRLAQPAFGAPALIAELVGALALLVFLLLAMAYGLKLLRHREAVRAEFRHPVSGSFFGTIVISLLLLSAVLAPYGAAFSQALWTLGTLATFGLSLLMVARLLKGGGEPAHAVPAWLIPGVATLDIVVTGATMPMAWAAEVNLAALAVGTVLALLLFSLIFARLVQQEPLAVAMRPSLMILVAPFSVGFLAYTQLFGMVDRFAGLLFYFGVFVFVLVAAQVFRRDVPFTPSWWGIGFPIAALSNAALKYAAVQQSRPLLWLAAALLALLTLAIAVLSLRTLQLLVNGKLLVAR